MTEPEILLYLLDHQHVSDSTPLRQLTGVNGVGRFHARYGLLEPDACEYVLKWPSHETAAHQLQLDLIVSRLGQLFEPPVTPTPRVATVEPGELVGVVCEETDVDTGQPCERGLPAGAVFASRRLNWPVKNLLPPQAALVSVARCIAFGVWLRCEDSEFVQEADTLEARNIDHEDSLRDAGDWHEGDVSNVAVLDIPRHHHAELRQIALYSSFLEQLGPLNEEQVVQCFAGIPANFMGTVDQRAHFAAYALNRRERVALALAEFCAN